MKRVFAVLFLLICVQSSFGQLSGNLSGTIGPGTFSVIGNISVLASDALQILPGTTFLFEGPYSFNIYGTLQAEGTAGDSIIFSADTMANPDKWRTLRFWDPGSSGSRLAYCLIENSVASGGVTGYGGGVFCYEASPAFRHCSFRKCQAGYGGGVYVYLGSPTFESCIFTGNACNSGGGGVRISTTSAEFTNCIITDNTAIYGGGLFCSISTTGSFVHCTFSNNSGVQGGGVYLYGCSPTISSTIISYSSGAGIYFNNSASAQIMYCDFYENSHVPVGFEGGDPAQGPAGIAIIGGTNANGDPCDPYKNILLPPDFVNPPTDDLHLSESSACIGAANPVAPPSLDFDGNPRPNPPASNPDIGAFEHGFVPTPVRLVITLAGGNAILHWSSTATAFHIYGSSEPFAIGDLLDTVSDTNWTDTNTSSRPSPYFYYVMVQEFGRVMR